MLTTFMALVAGNSDRVLWSVQGEGGVLSRRNPSSSAQGEGGDDVLKNEEGCAAVQEEGLEVSDVRRAIAQTLKAKGAGPKTELARSVEEQLRDLQSVSRSDGTSPNHGQKQRRCGEDAGQ